MTGIFFNAYFINNLMVINTLFFIKQDIFGKDTMIERYLIIEVLRNIFRVGDIYE